MHPTELFIRRPILSLVISLVILTAGLRALVSLPVQQFPRVVSATITIETDDYGADAATIAGFITTPVENAVAQAEGIDYITSTSTTGQSNVTLALRLNQDPNRSMTQVQALVAGIVDQLPNGFQQPIIQIRSRGDGIGNITYASHTLQASQVADWITRIAIPQYQAVPGIQRARLEGDMNLAMRVWLDPARLASYQLTATDAIGALQANDYVTGVGTTQGGTTFANLAITSGLHDADAFRRLIVKRSGSSLIRLSDIARIEIGPDQTGVSLESSEGHDGDFIGLSLTPGANLLEVMRGVRVVYDRLQSSLPPGIEGRFGYDASKYVTAARHEVIATLFEAMAIVAAVIFLFLGSARSVVIPIVTIPLSLIGTLALMSALGFSINLLTLLALVLSIGLVVDDAIIVVENVNRHLAAGLDRTAAAIAAARELGGPIVAMTVVLIAAYVPVGLQKGLTGALFTEFAFTLAGSVTVSAVLALTLSPMMCAAMLGGGPGGRGRLSGLGDRAFGRVQRVYLRALRLVLDAWPVAILAAVAIVAASGWLFVHATHELAPQEDQGYLYVNGQPPPTASFDAVESSDPEVVGAFRSIPQMNAFWMVDQVQQMEGGLILKPWNERRASTTEVQQVIQRALNHVAGLEIAVFQGPSLPGADGLPVQFVLKGSGSITELAAVADRMLNEARRSGLFAYIDDDLKIDQPQTTIHLDRERLGELGLNVSDVGNSLNWLLGGGYVNYFSMHQRSYRVMPLVVRDQRMNAAQILGYPAAYIGGVPVPLSSVASLTHQVVPEQINHFQQLTSTMLSGIPAPGVATDRALAYLQALAVRDLPSGFATDTAGPLRQYLQQAGTFLPTFAFGLVIIFLALAALFESFRDPIVILVAIPMSVAGAMLFLWLGIEGASVNVYSEIGLVTLAGLISKHGILIVEVANEQQAAGRSKRAAIEHAAALRLRPILMTTAAMVLGVMPLVLASGAGAAARYVMGLVIASGLSIGTVFTLFVVPAVYLAVAARHVPGRGAAPSLGKGQSPFANPID